MCDRVCVDLCSLLRPGEGMLVGSFARALFLVHSEVCGHMSSSGPSEQLLAVCVDASGTVVATVWLDYQLGACSCA